MAGEQGPQGPQGYMGAQGPIGLLGTQGSQGPDGEQGEQGYQGYMGVQGPTGGAQGSQGSQGTQGDIGAQGSQGEPGATDKISEGDSSVEVIDAGTGYIETKADNQQVRKDQVLGNIQPLQPCFLARLSATDNNVTGNGTAYTLGDPTDLVAIFDIGSTITLTNGYFTAPVTAKYIFWASAHLDNMLASAKTNMELRIATTGGTYRLYRADAANTQADPIMAGSIILPMTAGHTAYISLTVWGGNLDVRVQGTVDSHFGAAIIC